MSKRSATSQLIRPRYRGRFAPSPSGPLHFGSLIAALASYLQAKHQHGEWLVRIEDIDPPREQPGAATQILKTLEAFGLHWDGSVRYQSQQGQYYQALLAELYRNGQSYYCRCSRKSIQANGGFYSGFCRDKQQSQHDSAIRLRNHWPVTEFNDLVQGVVTIEPELGREDFIIHRRDGLYAYQLAVVADDIDQQITEIVRGADLLAPTARQITLYQALNASVPTFAHVAVIVDEMGRKLSKQNRAPALNTEQPQAALLAALNCLNQSPSPALTDASVEEIIAWATKNWALDKLPATTSIPLSPQYE